MLRYDSFRKNGLIDGISSRERWTVSTQDKIPVDIYWLTSRGQVRGAKYNNELSLATLDSVHELIPRSVNYAFYMDALIDKFVILDIEPKCPDEIKSGLMSIPCLYAETSMSGKGIHIAFRLPEDILAKYPDARQKVAMKEKHGYYEILMNHYVTFTGNEIPYALDTGDKTAQKPFRDVFRELAKKQKVVARSDVEVELVEDLNIPSVDAILQRMMTGANYNKTLDDFDGDRSKFEFAFIAHKYFWMKRLLNTPAILADHRYTDAETAWLLYKIGRELLPYRPKHDEERNGMPWLMYLAYEVIAQNKNRPLS